MKCRWSLPVAVAGVCGGAGAPIAQTCQPCWTNIPTVSLPDYPGGVRLAAGVGDEGPGVYEVGASSGDIHYWDGGGWTEIPRTGISSQYQIFDLRFLDEGLGSKLY